jgi:hypothetical protein
MRSASKGTKRVRARKACLPCSTRKRKCDGEEPCSACRGYGYVCSYSGDVSRQYRTSGNHSSLSDDGECELLGIDTASVSNQPLNIRNRPESTANTSNGHQTEVVRDRGAEPLAVRAVRYISDYSLQAFPRYLDLQLNSGLSNLESFGWNLGIRNITAPQKRTPYICSFVDLAATKHHLRRLFAIQFPACGFLDLDAIIYKCDRHWAGFHQGLQFESLLAAIIGLSCILAPAEIGSQLQSEVNLMGHAESILTHPHMMAQPTMEGVAATLLLCQYLRATSTLQVTWLMSCNNMHAAENLGLHKDYNDLAKSGSVHNSEEWNPQATACLFWMICTMNRIMSYELGRTPVHLREVTQKFPFAASDNSSAANFCRLGQLLPLDYEVCCKGNEFQLTPTLEIIEGIPTDQPYVKLLAADVCFCLFRRIRVNNSNIGGGITHRNGQQIALIGREAVQVVNLTLRKGQAWWNMLSTLFHFACVLISLDSDSLSDLQDTIQTIHFLGDWFPGSQASDALNTINKLAYALKQRKEKHLQYLSLAVRQSSRSEVKMTDSSSADHIAQSNWDWSLGVLDWDELDMAWMHVDNTAATAAAADVVTRDSPVFHHWP